MKTLKGKAIFIREGDGKVNFDGYWVYPKEVIDEVIQEFIKEINLQIGHVRYRIKIKKLIDTMLLCSENNGENNEKRK